MFVREHLDYQPVPLPDRADLSDDKMRKAALNFLATMRRRHTVRDFSDRPVDRSVIETAVQTAGTAPSGANHQPWHFAAISDPRLKARVREAAEQEEERFYVDGGAGDEWLKALEPIGTNQHKPHLEIAPWLIVVFAQRWGEFDDGTRFKNYYVPESVGIATGFLQFLGPMLGRPASEKPTMIIAVGHPAQHAMVPAVAKRKKQLGEIMSIHEADNET
jgi:nitroreductase